MKIRKTFIPIVVVILFLGITISPGFSAQDPENKEQMLTVWMPGLTEDDYSIQMEVTQEQLNEVNNTVNDFLVLVEAAKNENSPGGTKITVSEWQDIKIMANEIINSIKVIVGDDFPDLDIEAFLEDTIESLFNPIYGWTQRASIFSVGRGFSWIPFYDYETFIGVMIRPIFITHIIGFTGVLHYNPFPFRIEYADRIGIYRFTTLAFVGIFINFGDIGFDRIVGNVLCIGKGYNIMGSDFP